MFNLFELGRINDRYGTEIHDDNQVMTTGKEFRKDLQDVYSSGCRHGIDLAIMAVAVTGLIGIATDAIRKSKDKD